MVMGKVVDQPKTTHEQLVNDLKADGTTVTKNTTGNTLHHYWIVILQRLQGPPVQESTCTGLS